MSAALLPALVVTIGLAGCAYPRACPEMGWVNTLEIELAGPTDAVDLVRLCVDGECAGLDSRQLDENTWEVPVSMGMSTPTPVTIQALSGEGVVIAEAVTDIDWTRADATDACGGPSAATVGLAL
ncbi:hypothetical protein [Glaciihabitans tibetensis]|uniref:hypothetical protein n=1 Tax=Glaciihabitans tibetensis TaxID=1266600 RepID=UPI000D063D26|nr:hypothetical protein [Glaciihabitans tibetensis]